MYSINTWENNILHYCVCSGSLNTMVLLKAETHFDVNFIINGGTGGCYNDNLHGHEWQWNQHHDNARLLTHWGRAPHICVGKLAIIGSDNGLSPGRRQAIIWTNTGILLIGPLGTNCSEIIIEIYIFSFKKMHLKMSSGKWRPFCLGLIVLSE